MPSMFPYDPRTALKYSMLSSDEDGGPPTISSYPLGTPAGGTVSPPAAGNISSPWKSFMGYLNGPMGGTTAGDADSLMAYKPVSRSQGIGQTLLGAAQGVLNARGPYRNPLGQGLVGAGMGYQQAQQEDMQRRQAAVQDQYKQMASMMQMVQAQAALAKAQAAGRIKAGPGEIVYDQNNQPVATGGPRTGETNGYTYTLGPDGKPQPTGYFPQAPQSIEGYATQAITGQPQGPQVYGGGGGGQPGLPPKLDPNQAASLLQKFTMLKQPVMNVDYRQAQAESKYAQDMGAQSAEAYKNYMAAGQIAQKTLDNNKLLRGLADTVDTGPHEQTMFRLQQAASSIGIPDGMFANMTGGQAFNAIAGKSVLDAAGGHFSQGFSDADRNFAGSLVANLGNTKQANHILLDASDEANRRVKLAQEEAIKWEAKHRANGGLYAADDKGQIFDMHMQKWADEHPIYTPEWLKKHGLDPENPFSGAAATPAPGGGTPLDRY